MKAINSTAVKYCPAHSAVWCSHQSNPAHRRPRFNPSSLESCHRPVQLSSTVPRSRTSTCAPSPVTGNSGFQKSRTKTLLRTRRAEILLLLHLHKRRVISQPGTLVSQCLEAGSTICYIHIAFQKEKIIIKNPTKQTKNTKQAEGRHTFPLPLSKGRCRQDLLSFLSRELPLELSSTDPMLCKSTELFLSLLNEALCDNKGQ